MFFWCVLAVLVWFLWCRVVFLCVLCEFFLVGFQRVVVHDEKKVKKVLAGNGKGCTFAPAKREGEDT